MNGKQHETLNLIALFPTLFLLGYYHAALTFSILFVFKWIWNTYYFLGAWLLGGVFPVASHLVTDKL